MSLRTKFELWAVGSFVVLVTLITAINVLAPAVLWLGVVLLLLVGAAVAIYMIAVTIYDDLVRR